MTQSAHVRIEAQAFAQAQIPNCPLVLVAPPEGLTSIDSITQVRQTPSPLHHVRMEGWEMPAIPYHTIGLLVLYYTRPGFVTQQRYCIEGRCTRTRLTKLLTALAALDPAGFVPRAIGAPSFAMNPPSDHTDNTARHRLCALEWHHAQADNPLDGDITWSELDTLLDTVLAQGYTPNAGRRAPGR